MTWPHAHIAVAAAAHGPSEASARHMDSAALPSGPAPRMSMPHQTGIAAIITRHASRLRFRSETNRQRYIDTQMTLARCSGDA